LKFATFIGDQGIARPGLVDTSRHEILDLLAAGCAHESVLSLIESGEKGLSQARDIESTWPARATRPLSDAKLLSPLPVPQSIRDCLVFETHLRNAGKTWEKLANRPPMEVPAVWYERPTWYKGNRFSVVGHESDVQWPLYSKLMDFELELACVIGRQGRDMTPAESGKHIFGYTIFNDFSARDVQMIERPLGMGPMKGKDFDTGNVLGPWIVTPDEIGDPQNLEMEVRVNGERWGGGSSSEMQHSFAQIVSFISDHETLHPGEVIASGTVGTGCGLELNRFLEPGDVVELEIQGIGVLRNRIVKGSG
jgi:2-keto-4-pentenoate hydratase/2-oxohepta-3-ene-1,7-dioic acid hydratase in catechol pathway